MISLKCLVFVALAVAAVAARDIYVEYPEDSQNVIVGTRESGDFLIKTDRLVREPRPKRWIVFRPFDVPDEYEITQVRVIDQTNGSGGPATYEYGGPGMTRVLLGFSSDPNQGIDYKIELYGKLYQP